MRAEASVSLAQSSCPIASEQLRVHVTTRSDAQPIALPSKPRTVKATHTRVAILTVISLARRCASRYAARDRAYAPPGGDERRSTIRQTANHRRQDLAVAPESACSSRPWTRSHQSGIPSESESRPCLRYMDNDCSRFASVPSWRSHTASTFTWYAPASLVLRWRRAKMPSPAVPSSCSPSS